MTGSGAGFEVAWSRGGTTRWYYRDYVFARTRPKTRTAVAGIAQFCARFHTFCAAWRLLGEPAETVMLLPARSRSTLSLCVLSFLVMPAVAKCGEIVDRPSSIVNHPSTVHHPTPNPQLLRRWTIDDRRSTI
jgi:hypothetical protein